MKRSHVAVALVGIAAAVACVLLVIEAGHRVYRTIGPSKSVAARDGRLYVLSHGGIHVFDTAGKRVDSAALAALGASLTPSDLAVHADGRIVIANPDGSDVLRCKDLKGPCERLTFGLMQLPGQAALPLNSVKVFVDDERGRYYLSDNAGHRLVVAGFDGRVLSRSVPRSVWYPNQLALTAPGELTVVDTNHKRVVTFSVSDDRIGNNLRSLSTRGAAFARDGREWPFDAVRAPGGGTWVLIATEGMKDADLVVFDADGVARSRVDLGPEADPFDLEVWRDRVIVADATRYRLDAVAASGQVEAAVSDAGFLAELAAERERVELWKGARLAAMFGIGLFPLLAAIALKSLGAPVGLTLEIPPPIAPAASAGSLAEEVHWVKKDPRHFEELRRRERQATWGMLAFLVVTMVVGLHLFGDAVFASMDLVWKLLAYIAILIASLGFSKVVQRWTEKQFNHYRIGASRAGLHYEVAGASALAWGAPRKALIPWRDVYYDGRQLLAGRLLLLVQPTVGPSPFDRDDFAAWVAANIPKANRVSSMVLSWKMLAASGSMYWLMLGLVILVAIFLLARQFIWS